MRRAMTMTLLCLVVAALGLASCARAERVLPGQDEPAKKILELILAEHPTPESLPEGSTYNYIWAENMLAWMAAEKCGYASREDVVRRLRGLLTTVSEYETHHGFYFDAYDPATGRATTDKVYFQSWWLWALILTREAYPEVAPLAAGILDRVDYVSAEMINSDRTALAADVFPKSGEMSFWFRPDGDIAGELRTAFIVYTILTDDPTPWLIRHEPKFIDVAGHKTLSVWYHFTFDPFYVHTSFPETGYFQRSWDELIKGAHRHRAENGMTFFATRMNSLHAWDLDPEQWPNTEHRVAKPWNAWILEPRAPVMQLAWSPGYGVTQYFDNWQFAWSIGGIYQAHEVPIGSNLNTTDSRLRAEFLLETLPGNVDVPNPPRLERIRIRAFPDSEFPPDSPLIVTINGIEVARIRTEDVEGRGWYDARPNVPALLGARNEIQLLTEGYGVWRIERTEDSFRTFQTREGQYGEWRDTPAGAVEVYVTGQRAARENPFAFLARLSGVHDFQVWQLIGDSDLLADRSVAWVGEYNQQAWLARVLHNVSGKDVLARRILTPAEQEQGWKIVDSQSGVLVPYRVKDGAMEWTQAAGQTVRIQRNGSSLARETLYE